ncbi:hypothetical protein FHR32_000304 [Streptosporangium album]|uniref:Uncharacterized protein n=1 Tax=Streptosporangium album TaxID=47479 RepID=A0A7W7W7F6_9ACTN|nr:hypothetical protein [Streptosporangium album]MBB4935999.1 hypothetical protein [Streptosporangium album]
MALRQRKVVFARINRRRPNQDTLAMRSFAEDMAELARSRRTAFTEPATDASTAKTWFAADMDIQAGRDFMIGTLGFSEPAERREFNPTEWSWIKGDTEVSDTASEETVVPFAVDLRDSQRWVAFATAARLQQAGFTKGLQEILNQAVVIQGHMPTEWDVDLITSRSSVDAWLHNNPLVHKMRRTVKFSNPGRDIDADRQEMRALAARRKTEEFAAARNGVLNTESEEFRSKLNGTETGDLELELSARGQHGVAEALFKSKEQADQKQIDDFGRDLMHGMQIVLGALREYVAAKPPAAGYEQASEG